MLGNPVDPALPAGPGSRTSMGDDGRFSTRGTTIDVHVVHVLQVQPGGLRADLLGDWKVY